MIPSEVPTTYSVVRDFHPRKYPTSHSLSILFVLRAGLVRGRLEAHLLTETASRQLATVACGNFVGGPPVGMYLVLAEHLAGEGY